MRTISKTERTNSSYLLLMLITSIFALIVVGSEVTLELTDSSRQILDYADDTLCGIFFVDFCVTFWRSPSRLRYFFTWGWIDFLSCVPNLDLFRLGRATRLFRIFRVLRAIRAAKILGEFILRGRAKNTILAITLMSGLLMIFASIGVLHFETSAASNIRTAEDALWWTAETITTVGYGDKYPVTSEGRVFGVLLMAAGIALMGAYSGFIAYWFLRPINSTRDAEMARLRAELDRLQQLEIERRRSEVSHLRERLRDQAL